MADNPTRTDAEKLAACEALVRGAQGSRYFGGGWDDGIVSVRRLAAALGIEPNGPPPPLTAAESAEIGAMLDEIRAERKAGA